MGRAELRQKIRACSGEKRTFPAVAGGPAAASQGKISAEEKWNSDACNVIQNSHSPTRAVSSSSNKACLHFSTC